MLNRFCVFFFALFLGIGISPLFALDSTENSNKEAYGIPEPTSETHLDSTSPWDHSQFGGGATQQKEAAKNSTVTDETSYDKNGWPDETYNPKDPHQKYQYEGKRRLAAFKKRNTTQPE